MQSALQRYVTAGVAMVGDRAIADTPAVAPGVALVNRSHFLREVVNDPSNIAAVVKRRLDRWCLVAADEAGGRGCGFIGDSPRWVFQSARSRRRSDSTWVLPLSHNPIDRRR